MSVSFYQTSWNTAIFILTATETSNFTIPQYFLHCHKCHVYNDILYKKYGKLVVLHYPGCYSERNICLKSIEMLLWIINFHLQVLGIQTKF